MYFDGAFRAIGHADTTTIRQYIDALPEHEWEQHGSRQKTYKVHSKTQTIPLIFDEDFRHRFPTEQPKLADVRDAIQPAMTAIQDYFTTRALQSATDEKPRINKCYFVRAIMVRLPAGAEIDTHTDHGYSLSRSHRIHWPVITNEQVEFVIDGKMKSLNIGELWEVNNRQPHSVKNAGDTARVHLIFDFVIPNEQVIDPLEGSIRT